MEIIIILTLLVCVALGVFLRAVVTSRRTPRHLFPDVEESPVAHPMFGRATGSPAGNVGDTQGSDNANTGSNDRDFYYWGSWTLGILIVAMIIPIFLRGRPVDALFIIVLAFVPIVAIIIGYRFIAGAPKFVTGLFGAGGGGGKKGEGGGLLGTLTAALGSAWIVDVLSDKAPFDWKPWEFFNQESGETLIVNFAASYETETGGFIQRMFSFSKLKKQKIGEMVRNMTRELVLNYPSATIFDAAGAVRDDFARNGTGQLDQDVTATIVPAVLAEHHVRITDLIVQSVTKKETN